MCHLNKELLLDYSRAWCSIAITFRLELQSHLLSQRLSFIHSFPIWFGAKLSSHSSSAHWIFNCTTIVNFLTLLGLLIAFASPLSSMLSPKHKRRRFSLWTWTKLRLVCAISVDALFFLNSRPRNRFPLSFSIDRDSFALQWNLLTLICVVYFFENFFRDFLFLKQNKNTFSLLSKNKS